MITRIFVIIILLISNSKEAFAQAKASQAVNLSTKNAKPEAPQKQFWTYGSLMLDNQTYLWIKEAIKSNEQKIPLEILLPNLFPPPDTKSAIIPEEKSAPIIKEEPIILAKPEEIKEAPAFYLKSILYFAPDNWSLWLNDHKISNKTADSLGTVTITEVSSKYVIFLWKRSRIDLIWPSWKEHCAAIDEDKYSCAEKNIVVDTATSNISFILRPNQSLISKTLEIVEGPAKSTVLTNMQAPAAAATSAAGASMPTSSAKTDNLISKSLDPTEAIKNIETLKNILNQNVQQLH